MKIVETDEINAISEIRGICRKYRNSGMSVRLYTYPTGRINKK